MKKSLYIIVAAACLCSCENSFLENKVQSNIVKEDYYKTLSQYETALTGCYYYISGRGTTKEGNYCVGIPVVGEAGTDECYANTGKGAAWDFAAQLDQYGQLITSNLACQEIWLNHYSGINAALEITDRIFAMDPAFLDANPRYREIAAEASFLQALWYFNLVRIYGGVPIRTHATTEDEDLIRVERDSIEKVYDRIFVLLDYAKENLPEAPSGNQLGRAKKVSAYALSAKANLQVASSMNLLTIPQEVTLGGINTFDWTLEGMSREQTIQTYYERARDDAKFVLDYFAPNYLMPEFTDCFYPHESSKEILFEGILSSGLSVELGGWFGSLYGPAGASALGGGQQVLFGNNAVSMNQFTFSNAAASGTPQWTSQDKRFLWTWATFRVPATGYVVVPVAQIYNQTQIGKFRIDQPAPYNQDRTPVNIPILRTSEVCLIYAEAQAELDNMVGLGITSQALEFLNVVRTRAGVENYTAATIKNVIPLIGYTSGQTRGNNEIKGWTDDTDIGCFRRAILNERSMELIGEGHRWYDLVRMGVLQQVVSAVTDFSNGSITGVGTKSSIPARTIQPFHIFRPIPSREIALHQGWLKQNYGYLQ